VLRADFLRRSGDLDAALAGYKEVMARNDTADASSRAFFEYAAVQLVEGDGKGAMATVDEGLKRWPDDALGLYERGIFELVDGRSDDAAGDLARSIEAGEKYRMQSILLNTGFAEQTGERADKSSYYAYAEPFLPIAIEVILFLDAARSKAGQDGSDELKKNFDDIEFALRPIGSLQPAELVGWPVPIINFYLGQIGVDGLLAQAEKSASANSVRPLCTANLFAGLRAEKGADYQEVQRRLRTAAEKCPASSLARSLAITVLGRRIP
jgi:tetratricopeptide (TPR) repeat protein